MENTVSGVSGPKISHEWAKCISAKKRKVYLSHFGTDDIVDPP